MRTLFVVMTLLAVPAQAQERVPEIPFESVPDFLKLPEEMNFGEVPAVAVNSRGQQVHGMACPAENELYVAEILTWRVQKLRLRPARTQTN